MRGGEGERESTAGSMPSAEPEVELDLTMLRIGTEPISRVGCLMEGATPEHSVLILNPAPFPTSFCS